MVMSLDSRPACVWMLCTHSSSSYSNANTSALVEMAVSGVFNSWLAFVMNCFCASMFLRYGVIARREKRTTSPNTTTRHTAAIASVIHSSDRMVCISRSELRNSTTVSSSVVSTR